MLKPINKQELEEMQKDDVMVRLIDIRPAAEFEKQHVSGAINIPSDQLSNELESFNKHDRIVCVCTYGKERSQQAAEFLQNSGFENSFYLEGGTVEWCKNVPASDR